jgi:Transposase DDE domain group 1
VMQPVVGIALGYEDLNDHDELRHDPVLAVLANKLVAQRPDCAPLAGKTTLNRLELSRAEPTRGGTYRLFDEAVEWPVQLHVRRHLTPRLWRTHNQSRVARALT